MSRVVAIVQARLGSRRFPGKALAILNGDPLIAHVMNRARAIVGIDRLVLAVPFREGRAFRAVVNEWVVEAHDDTPEDDVLARYAWTARITDASVVMRLTGDCVVLDPIVAGQVLQLFQASRCDFASNDTLVSGYPDGWDVEVFSRAALETAHAQATDQQDREHVTPWMRRNLHCVRLDAPTPWTGPKLSIDTEDDLQAVRDWLQTEECKCQ